MATLTQPAGRRINLPGGLIFSTEYDRYLLGQDVAASCPFPVLGAEFPLNLPGETHLPGWRIEASIISREQTKEEAAKGKGIGLIDNLFTAYLDFDKTGDKLLVRNRQPSDRFQPLGMSQPKKLNGFMIDAKIPGAWRQRIPIVCSPSQILWVVGWRIDDRVKVSDTTRRILCLKFERD
jgi:tRNA(Ile)-lysidine synthase